MARRCPIRCAIPLGELGGPERIRYPSSSVGLRPSALSHPSKTSAATGCFAIMTWRSSSGTSPRAAQASDSRYLAGDEASGVEHAHAGVEADRADVTSRPPRVLDKLGARLEHRPGLEDLTHLVRVHAGDVRRLDPSIGEQRVGPPLAALPLTQRLLCSIGLNRTSTLATSRPAMARNASAILLRQEWPTRGKSATTHAHPIGASTVTGNRWRRLGIQSTATFAVK